MKSIIIGSPGSGKSYFAKLLMRTTHTSLYHMDNIYWKSDKSHITRQELMNEISIIMKKNSWIIDGNYISTMEQRVKEADTIFLFDCPVDVCLDGIISRVGKKRDDMPWVEEKPDEELIEYVLDFKSETMPLINGILVNYVDKHVIIFKSRNEAEEWLS